MFFCQKCGACCRDLLTDYKNFRLGLWLFPEETKLFPTVKPMWGFGLKGRSRPRPESIGVYQFAEDVCPHLSSNNLCEIYEKRPMICRSFPLTVNFSGWTASVENRCPAAKFIKKGQSRVLDEDFPEDILAANVTLHTRFQKLLTSTNVFWIYDLKAGKWNRITQST